MNIFSPLIEPPSFLFNTFIDFLIMHVYIYIHIYAQTLYRYGARKVAIFGLGPIGCSPAELDRFGASLGSTCVDDINDAIVIFNQRLVAMVDTLNKNYKDAKFTYINILGMASGDPKVAGNEKRRDIIFYFCRRMFNLYC